MDHDDFWQKRKERGPCHCQWCEHWGGPANPGDPDGSIWCILNRRVNAIPRDGCSCWAKATGLDNDQVPPRRENYAPVPERIVGELPSWYARKK